MYRNTGMSVSGSRPSPCLLAAVLFLRPDPVLVVRFLQLDDLGFLSFGRLAGKNLGCGLDYIIIQFAKALHLVVTLLSTIIGLDDQGVSLDCEVSRFTQTLVEQWRCTRK